MAKVCTSQDLLQTLLVNEMLWAERARWNVISVLKVLNENERQSAKDRALEQLGRLGRSDLIVFWNKVFSDQVNTDQKDEERNRRLGRKINSMAFDTYQSVQTILMQLMIDGLKNSGSIDYILAEVDDEERAKEVALANLVATDRLDLANLWSQHWRSEKRRIDDLNLVLES